MQFKLTWRRCRNIFQVRFLFDANGLVLFRNGGVDAISPRPAAVPIRTLTRLANETLAPAPLPNTLVPEDVPAFSIPLRLRPSELQARNVTATVLPVSARTGEGMAAWFDWLNAFVGVHSAS